MTQLKSALHYRNLTHELGERWLAFRHAQRGGYTGHFLSFLHKHGVATHIKVWDAYVDDFTQYHQLQQSTQCKWMVARTEELVAKMGSLQ